MVKKKTEAAPITDKRFASFETDPRFRLPSRKHAKTTLDKRFSGLLKDNDFTATARVDRYGRKIKSDSKKKALERLYQVEEEEEEEEKEVEVEDDEVVERELRTADKSLKKYDPAREGGFSSSEDEDEDEDDEDEDEEAEDEETAATRGGDMRRLAREEVELGEVTNRIAIVNLDWDHVKSTDLMALFTSFIPAGNAHHKITNIAVYPSEFGKERMQQEELEGPPKELFSKKKNKRNDDHDSDSDSDDGSASDSEAEEASIKKTLIQEGNDTDFDSDALRAYQLDRLRYYYAVMTCSSPELAKAIYDATDGTEYQSSSNFIDLRFVPDEVAFDADEPRDTCDKVPEAYKPIEFVTNALQSSRVKLTWDMHPEEVGRKDSIKRAFKGSRAELDEQDLKAYLAGDSSDSENDDEEDGGDDQVQGDGEAKLSKKELARKKMREALGLADEPAKRAKDGPVGGMEVTFTPALSGESSSKKDKKKDGNGEEETTIEKYARKERERKEKKRQAAKAKREDQNDDQAQGGLEAAEGDNEEEDLGFNDPFFTIDDDDAGKSGAGTGAAAGPSKTALRKEERLKKREARALASAQDALEKSNLTAIMAQDDNDKTQAEHLAHFNMNDILRAEKLAGKKAANKLKGKRGREREEKEKARGGGNLQEEFEMDVGDERFRAVFESHEFAIDPSSSKFVGTEGMRMLLEEGRRKRAGKDEGGQKEKRVKRAKR